MYIYIFHSVRLYYESLAAIHIFVVALSVLMYICHCVSSYRRKPEAVR